jgi:hypothetical protein
VSEAVASFRRRVALQLVEGAGGETLTTINELRLPLFRPLAPPGGRRLSPFTPRVFANIFVYACSLCLPPSQLEKGNGVLKDLEQPAKATCGGGREEAVCVTMMKQPGTSWSEILVIASVVVGAPSEKILAHIGEPDPNLVTRIKLKLY